MLPSVTKDLFSFSITEPASPAVCTRGCNCVISKLNRKCHIKTDKRKCERMQKRRERNGRVTNYSNNSSIKPPNASFKENASPTGSQKLQRVYIPIRYASFVIGKKNRQVAEFLQEAAQLCKWTRAERQMCRRKRCWTQRSPRCLPEVLRGSCISFPSNALFVDKSKLMIVKREAFGGKILLTLLRLNLTTEQDTSSCRNDRLL